jgi:hypothetical protein
MKNKQLTRLIWPLILFIAASLYVLNRVEFKHTPAAMEQDPYMRNVPLPKNAIRLKLESRFPEEDGQFGGPFLSAPSSFVLAPPGNLFITDARNNEIAVFDPAGRRVSVFGRTGQGPGEFSYPAEIVSHGQEIVVREVRNMRLQFFDLSGRYSGGFRIFRTYTSIAAVENRIYAAPMIFSDEIPDRGASLIDILDLGGRLLRSFGAPLDINRKYFYHMLNEVLLSAGADGDLWVVFRCFPIVRRYSLDGELLAEYRLEHELAEMKEAYNIKAAIGGGVGKSQPSYLWIAYAVFTNREGLYLVDSTAGNRLLIVFMRTDGKLSRYFWAPLEEKGFVCKGLVVIEDAPYKKFYILKKEDACVEVYKTES